MLLSGRRCLSPNENLKREIDKRHRAEMHFRATAQPAPVAMVMTDQTGVIRLATDSDMEVCAG